MMLRASIEHAGPSERNDAAGFDPRPIVAGCGDIGVAHSDALLRFVDAVILRDLDEYPTARADLELRIGRGATDRAAMVAGNFSMMNRALDAIGARVGHHFDELAAGLGVSIPAHLLGD